MDVARLYIVKSNIVFEHGDFRSNEDLRGQQKFTTETIVTTPLQILVCSTELHREPSRLM